MSIDEVGSVLHPFQPRLHQRGELVEAMFGEVGQGPLQVRPHALDSYLPPQIAALARKVADALEVPRPATT
uniref:hypothetical protein n=1 Tax=Streptomyces doebereineriae TaxID=3075528 RepID=UPI00374E1C10